MVQPSASFKQFLKDLSKCDFGTDEGGIRLHEKMSRAGIGFDEPNWENRIWAFLRTEFPNVDFSEFNQLTAPAAEALLDRFYDKRAAMDRSIEKAVLAAIQSKPHASAQHVGSRAEVYEALRYSSEFRVKKFCDVAGINDEQLKKWRTGKVHKDGGAVDRKIRSAASTWLHAH